MHSTWISTIGYLVFQISTSSHSLAASLDLSPSNASSHPTLPGFSSPTHASQHGDNTGRSVASGSRIKSRNVEKHQKSKKKKSACRSSKFKKYRVRAKLEGVVGKVEDVIKPVDAKAGVEIKPVYAKAGVEIKPVDAKAGVDIKPVDAKAGVAVKPDDGDAKSGDATYYGTGLGACGIDNKDDHMIAAASHLLFDSFPGATANPNLNPICGRKVKATYQGNSVEVQIVDRCTGCAMNDLDFSPAAFAKLGAKEIGRLHHMTWEWM